MITHQQKNGNQRAHLFHQMPEHKRHIILWIVTGSAMAFVIVFWTWMLPSQLHKMNIAQAANVARWYTVKAGESAKPKKSFSEVLDDMKGQFDQLQKIQQGQTQVSTSSVAKIKSLQEKIEASKKP